MMRKGRLLKNLPVLRKLSNDNDYFSVGKNGNYYPVWDAVYHPSTKVLDITLMMPPEGEERKLVRVSNITKVEVKTSTHAIMSLKQVMIRGMDWTDENAFYLQIKVTGGTAVVAYYDG